MWFYSTLNRFSCCCAHYCHCFCRCFSSSEPPLYARAIYDFVARNGHELSVTKGDVVQVKVSTRCRGSLKQKPFSWLPSFPWSSNRWWKSPTTGGSFATAARKAAFPRTFWSWWAAAAQWKTNRWAEPRSAALRSNFTSAFIPFALRHSGTPAGPSPWTWTPRHRRSRPGWSTKASPECEWKVWRLVLFTRQRLTVVVAARWTRSVSWRVNCCWGWPRRRSGPCVQKRAAKSSSSCRLSDQPWQWVRFTQHTRTHASLTFPPVLYSSPVNKPDCSADGTESPPLPHSTRAMIYSCQILHQITICDLSIWEWM